MKKSPSFVNGVEAYLQALKDSITGPFHANCHIAAIQLISNNEFAPPSLYSEYKEAYYAQDDKNDESYIKPREMFRTTLSHFGGHSLKRMSIKKAKTLKEFEAILLNARQGTLRVLMYITNGHVVGLRPVSKGWKMVGTWVPTTELSNKHASL